MRLQHRNGGRVGQREMHFRKMPVTQQSSVRKKLVRVGMVLPTVFLLAATRAPGNIQESVPEEVKIRIPELWSWGIACFFGWVLAGFKALDLRKGQAPDRLLPPQD